MTNVTISDESEALAVAYRDMRKELLRFFTYKTGSAEVAEDLLHEVFRKALAAQQKKLLPRNLVSWLHTISRNTLVDFYRTRKANVELPDVLAQDDEDVTVDAALSRCLLPLIRQLPTIYQTALIAADIEERPLQSIADDEDVSLSAIKSRVSRGRKQLKTVLFNCCEITLAGSGVVEDYTQKQSDCGCAAE